MLRLTRRRPDPAPLPWSPHEQDRVVIKGAAAVHTVVWVDGDAVQCVNLDHPDTRTTVPASWLRPVDPELRPRPANRTRRGWWSR